MYYFYSLEHLPKFSLSLDRYYIDAEYPVIQKKLKRTTINNYSLLYEWKGTNPGKKPIILLAHMDVVPENENKGKIDPFQGIIQDEIIWGRGTLDDKGSLFSILEAVENLLESGFTPERTIYLAFGHDEEAGTTGGMNGAGKIAEHLKNEGIHAEFVIDEGSTIIDEKLSPVKGKKFALVGVAEKGFITLKITATGQGGHSSMPGKDTAIGLLTKALTDLEKHKFPSSLNGTMSLSLDYFGPEMPFHQRVLFANRWLFGGLIMPVLEKSSASAAMLHTTIAPTIIQGGSKEQSLPVSALAIINFRIIPGETSQDVIKHVKSSFSDPRIKVEQFGAVVHEPAPISKIDSKSFNVISQTIREVFPDVMVAPGLVTGRTDSVYYKVLADNVYRFAPYLFGPDELNQVHGLDERISVDSYLIMVQFYIRFIQNSASSMKE
jgi:carboxypeptidase PM20D1